MDKYMLLDAIRKYLFYALELNLYIDNFPDCKEANEDYKKVSKKLNNFIEEYETNYGQLINFGFSNDSDSCSWTNDPWPWEQEKNRRCCK